MTIRFHCEKCGKSLRADQEIIGRLTRCSKCGAKVRVPAESTRKSGEKNLTSDPFAQPIADKLDSSNSLPPPLHQESQLVTELDSERRIASSDVFDEGILSVLGDSDKFEDLSDFDLGRFDPAAYHSKPMAASSHSRAPINQTDKPGKLAPNQPAASPAFRKKKKSQFLPLRFFSAYFPAPDKFSPKVVILAGVLVIAGLLSIGGLALWLSLDNFTLEKSELYQSGMGSRYKSVLTELKRSQGALATMQQAHISKGLPSDQLTQANELLQKFAKMTDGHPGLRSAERQLRRGDEKEGRKMFHLEIEAMISLKAEIDTETEQLKERTFSSR